MSDLATTAAELARAAPQKWADFLFALKTYADETKDNLVASPPDRLPLMQGRAQACAQLLQTLQQAIKIADQIEKRGKR